MKINYSCLKSTRTITTTTFIVKNQIMDILNNTSLDYMDYSFCFDDTRVNNNNNNNNSNSGRRVSTQRSSNNNSSSNNQQQRNRTLTSGYHFISSPDFVKNDDPRNRSSIYSVTNRRSIYDDDLDYLSYDSYRRAKNDDFASLPSQNEIENSYRYVDETSNELDKMKTKLTSFWNNVKYGWTTYVRKNKTNFDKTTPIHILGRFYSNDDMRNYHSMNDRSLQNTASYLKDDYCLVGDNAFKTFEDDISSRLWFTYRKDFPAINGTKYTSDAGWGCMLRSAQMLIAQGFLLHFYGRNWSLYSQRSISNNVLYREIISWFNDRFSNKCPFGLHRLLMIANEKIGKKVGDWFGPGSVILIIRDALESAKEFIPVLKNINIYVAQDCTVYKQDVLELCMSKPSDENEKPVFTPVIILVSVRLGGEELNEIYVPTLKTFLQEENCLGIIGGKPKHSLYFIGYQEEKVIYLDPHFVQDYVDMSRLNSYYELDNSSYHCSVPGKTSFSNIDPSLAVGFYCKTLEDFEKFCYSIQNCTSNKVKLKPNEEVYPIFSIMDDKYEKTHLSYRLSTCNDDTLISINASILNDHQKASPITKQPQAENNSNKGFNKKLNNLTKIAKFSSSNKNHHHHHQQQSQKQNRRLSNELDDFVLI